MRDTKERISLEQVLAGTALDGRIHELSGKSVLILTHSQLVAALAMIELDGIARRLVICPPGIPSEHLPSIVSNGEVDSVVFDDRMQWCGDCRVSKEVLASSSIKPTRDLQLEQYQTEWVLLTSGTTGVPKLVAHSLSSLTAPIKPVQNHGSDLVWGTFYDIRRYGGLQIFLRALWAAGSLVLSDGEESSNDHLLRLAAHSVTHINGTPSHWRRALMSKFARRIMPYYIRLSGEISDQAILNTLRFFYPQSSIAHAFASTEAGIGFEVTDELEGFPASFVGAAGEVELKVENSSLWIRSPRTAARYLGEDAGRLADAAGFIDTGDIVECRGDRYYFLGRRSGVINVGGFKVYPEEVEAQINCHPAVQMSCVRRRRNSITGSIVVADIVLRGEGERTTSALADIEQDILRVCRKNLPRHKVPVKLHFVSHLSVSATGKMARQNA